MLKTEMYTIKCFSVKKIIKLNVLKKVNQSYQAGSDYKKDKFDKHVK